MVLDCPHCSARYELPPRLLGPGGAQVRCPRCGRGFLVGATAEGGAIETRAMVAAAGRGAAGPPPASSDSAAAPEPAGTPAAAVDPPLIARAVLDELVARSGPALAEASARGRLLSEFGPAVVAAFAEYRRRSGGNGDPAPFRDALHERWGIQLAPRADQERTRR